MANHLIVGGNGLIGSALSAYLQSIGEKVSITTRRPALLEPGSTFLDLSNLTPMRFEGYDNAFLCAGVTNLSVCESDPSNTSKVNVDATLSLAAQLHESGCRVIYISSNTVFNGQIHYPDESTPDCSIIEYGRQKAEVERKMLMLGSGMVVVRISKICSLNLPVFSSIFRNLSDGTPFEVYHDLLFCPISLNYLCKNLAQIALSDIDGILHLSGLEDISYVDFSHQLAKKMTADQAMIKPVNSKTVLFHPRFAGLGMNRTTTLLGIHPEPIHLMLSNLLMNYQY